MSTPADTQRGLVVSGILYRSLRADAQGKRCGAGNNGALTRSLDSPHEVII